MDGKEHPDAATLRIDRRSPVTEALILSSRQNGPPRRRAKLIEHGRGDVAVTDPAEEGLVLRSRRRRAN